MAITVTITMSEDDPRARAILGLFAPSPGEDTTRERVLAAIRAREPIGVAGIAAALRADGGLIPSRQTIANTLQNLKRDGLVTLDGREWATADPSSRVARTKR